MSDQISGQDDLPSGWLHTQLGRVVNYGRTTKVEPSDIPGDAWVLELEDIEKNTSRILQRMTFSQRQSKSTKNKFFAGDVLYGKLRPYLNKVVIADRPGYCTTEIVPINAGLLDNRYLFYWLKHPTFLKYVEAESHGLNMPRLGTDTGNAAPFVLAPREEQIRIADQLDTLLARINACQRRLDNIPALLKRFRQALLDAATTGTLIEDWPTCDATQWPTVSLGAHASDFSYGTAAKSEKSGRVPVLCMGNIQGGRLDWTDLVYTSNEAEIKKYELKKGDVLFNRTNSPELVGKTAVYQGEQPAIYAGYLIRVRCNDDLLPEYLNYCLGSTAGRDFCWAVKSDGVSQSNINAEKLRSFSFLLPTRVEQHEIVRRAESLLRLVDRFEARYIAMHSHTQRLAPQVLAKAFRGELAPQDPRDEPAITLLERIAGASAEQAAISKPKKHTRRLELKSVTDEPLLNIIDHFDQADFTFDELRQATSLGYEALKNELFALLADPESGVAQHFDAEEKTMKLRRVRK